MQAETVRRRKFQTIVADTTFTLADLGTSFNNSGAAGTVVSTLPANATPGDIFFARVATAQNLTVKSTTAGIFVLGATTLTTGHGVSSSTVGDSCTLECIAANTWAVRDKVGSWADQA